MAVHIVRTKSLSIKILVALLLAILGSGCSYLGGTSKLQNGKLSKTSIGVMTGAALGAGAGAIIGSTTGAAGEGLAIGTVAGAAAGGAIGHHIEKRDNQLVSYREKVRRQNDEISENAIQIEELKRDTSDTYFEIPSENRSSIPGRFSADDSWSSSALPAKKQIGAVTTGSQKIARQSRARMGAVKTSPVSPRRVKPKAARPVKERTIWPRSGTRERSVPNKIVLGSKKEKSLGTPRKVSELPPAPRSVITERTDLVAKAMTNSQRSPVQGLPPAPALPKANNTGRERAELAARELGKSEDIIPPAAIVIPKVDGTREIVRPSIPAQRVASKFELREPVSIVGENEKDEKEQVASIVTSPGCAEAEVEAARARNASSDADKLFYFRRALRLCRKDPTYHVEIGRVYSSIGRSKDAKSSFRKALELDPGNDDAQDELSMIMLNTF